MMASPSPRSPPIQGGEGRVPFHRLRMPASLLPLEGGGREVGVVSWLHPPLNPLPLRQGKGHRLQRAQNGR
jgi:hypothetical protein